MMLKLGNFSKLSATQMSVKPYNSFHIRGIVLPKGIQDPSNINVNLNNLRDNPGARIKVCYRE